MSPDEFKMPFVSTVTEVVALISEPVFKVKVELLALLPPTVKALFVFPLVVMTASFVSPLSKVKLEPPDVVTSLVNAIVPF